MKSRSVLRKVRERSEGGGGSKWIGKMRKRDSIPKCSVGERERERVKTCDIHTHFAPSLSLSPSLSIQIFVERPSILVPCNPGCDLGA